MGATVFGENAVLQLLCTGGFVSLHTADPEASPNEVAGSAYTRIPYGPFTVSKVGANPSEAANNNLIEFPTATGSWGGGGNLPLTHFALWDAAIGGNMRVTGVIPTPKAIGNGDVVRFLAGTLKVTAT